MHVCAFLKFKFTAKKNLFVTFIIVNPKLKTYENP